MLNKRKLFNITKHNRATDGFHSINFGAIGISPIPKENMESTEQTQEPEVVDQAVDTHEKSPQMSFAELRKKADDAERKAWEANKELELMKQMQKQPVTPVQEEEFDYTQLAQQEFPDGKNLVKAFGSINKKLSHYEQQLHEKDIKIKALEFSQAHPDFKDIVTSENIEKYIKSDEDNFEAVSKSSDPLGKVYRLIKKSAAYQADVAAKATKSKPVSQEQKKVDEKDKAPRTGSMGVRSEAVSTAARLSNSTMTREQRNALWAETQAAARK